MSIPRLKAIVFASRKHHWLKLSRKTPFQFPPQPSLSELCINFKDACRRLWRILIVEGAFGGLIPTKCVHCRMYTCPPECVEDRNLALKYTIDIGGKFTWVITPSYMIEVSLYKPFLGFKSCLLLKLQYHNSRAG